MLKLVNIDKTYKIASGDVHALRGISLNFRKNEFVSILGPSGCGKTTLLNIIGGLDKYTSGDLVIEGRSTKKYNDRDWDVYRNHRIGFIFQSYNLIPHQTVLGNVELALTIAGLSLEQRREKAKTALIKVGLGDQLYKRPNQLSGGQCQRVAIARALVNDPDILLADEPTGALDTKTSVQIMNLMREIAGEKLVIMVTHNPELAEEYSNRIINLLDGKITGDSNPFDSEEETKEREGAVLDEKTIDQEKRKGRRKTKMGFWTAFALSWRNLLAKKGRTIMVGFAGSIGIIGVAIVLAFSAGIRNYIDSMQSDMLSGFPVTVSQTALDFSALSSLADQYRNKDENKGRMADKVYVNTIIETVAKLNNSISTNEITQEYVDYLDDLPEGCVEVVKKSYGINFAHNIYTDFSYGIEGVQDVNISITGIRSMYGTVLEKTEDYSQLAPIINTVGTFSELPNNKEYVLRQYEVLAGEYPENEKENMVLVLSKDSEINDILLAQFGYISQRAFLNYAYSLVEDNSFYRPSDPVIPLEFDYTAFCGEGSKAFAYYPNSEVYKVSDTDTSGNPNAFRYQTYSDDLDASKAVPMKIACVLKPKDSILYGSLSAGLYYSEALTQYALSLESNEASRSEVVKYAIRNNDQANNIKYGYTYYYDVEEGGTIVYNKQGSDKNNEEFGANVSSSTSGAASSSDVISTWASTLSKETFKNLIRTMLMRFGPTPEAQLDGLLDMLVSTYYSSSNKVVTLSALGGNNVPSSIRFYSVDFEKKTELLHYLDKWNETHDEPADKINYTDTLGLVMDLVDMLIMIVTIGLVAFTSVSLVVSTVMIGIITYVSVVERTKEIGIIRAMGGRKRDVKNLFNAETFIIGLIAGIIGVLATYVICFIFNIALGLNFGIYTIANLTLPTAGIMIAISVGLTLLSGLIPASAAARQDPVVALRTE